jgi:(p)ppGpp synthase/HD superfamily hydrolase
MQVYDARGLRVIVDDQGGECELEAVYCCYRLEQTLRGLFRPIRGEYDDYIANPKPSGYRALHLAFHGPDGRPLEV